MGYCLTAIRVDWKVFEDFVYGSKIKTTISETKRWHQYKIQEVNELFKGKKAITVGKAIEGILNGDITRTDKHSGAVYRYALKFILNCITVRRLDNNGEYKFNTFHKGPKFLNTIELKNDRFCPIKVGVAAEVLRLGEEIPLPFPQQDDFPLTSLIRLEKINELKKGIEFESLPPESQEQFMSWLNIASENQQDIVLFLC